MKQIAAYADRWSVAPGEELNFMVSSCGDLPFEAEVARIFCADPNPSGPGYREERLESPLDGRHDGRFHPVAPGSYGEAAVDLSGCRRISMAITVWPSKISGDDGVLWSFADERVHLVMRHDANGIAMRLAVGSTVAMVRIEERLYPRRWYDIDLVLDLDIGNAQLHRRPRAPLHGEPAESSAACSFVPTGLGKGILRFAGDKEASLAHGLFNGKLERPRIHNADIPIAEWDFSLAMSGDKIIDRGPNGWHGRLHNLPTRAVRGAGWTGRHLRWTEAPAEYAAIHFHKDDIGDLGWPAALRLTIPAGWKSGVYCLRLKHPHGIDEVPFFVRPSPEASKARVAILMSTFTYQVYGQWIRPGRGNEIAPIAAAWQALPDTPDQHLDYGLSPYNIHDDDSGVIMASALRPMIDKRIRQVSYADPSSGGSGTFWITADTYLIAWLERLNIPYDVITDHDLHDGSIILSGHYDVMLTGHHPEYHSEASLAAITGFLDAGGRLMYLGGNGFYWKVTVPDEMPWALELRREHGGVAVSATEPGEGCHSSDGSPGGLWRRLGFPPQERFGVGFSSQGYYKGYPYRLSAAILDPRLDFLRETSGLDLKPGMSFGDFGLMGGGAAGLELDRADRLLGTPPHALIIASALVQDPRFLPANEEYVTSARPFQPREHTRADIVFFETPAGGAVFSVGSMTYIGAMAAHAFDNQVAGLTEAMLRLMMDARPF